MKFILLAIVVMAVLPPSHAPFLVPLAAVAALLAGLGRRDYPTFETVTADRAMAIAADDRLIGLADRGR